MLVFGHRRSGNHLLINYLEKFFNERGEKRHEFHKSDLNSDKKKIYIARDGRDVLASCFEWWKSSGESQVCHISQNFQNVSFSQFLKGVTVSDFRPAPPGNVTKDEVRNGMFSDPIAYWYNHVIYGIFDVGLTWIKFEDLLVNPILTLNNLSNYYNMSLTKEPEKIEKLVGMHPRKGVKGDYVNYFTDKDETFFHEKTNNIVKYLLEK